MFTPIDTFLHETRELVQCALPGLTLQWPDRIRSCLMQALPSSWDQSLSCSDKSYQQIVEWVRAQTAKIQNTPQEEWEDWVKQAHRQNQKGGGVPNSNPNFKSAPNANQTIKCYQCGKFGHRSNSCGFQQQQEQQSQQQQNYRPQGQPQYAQNQNWRPQNQYQGNNPPGNANFSNFNQNQNSGVPRNQYGGNNFANSRNNAPTPQMNNNNNNRGYMQQQRPQQQQQPPQQQQNRSQGYGNRQPYTNPSVRFLGPVQENCFENNCGDMYNDNNNISPNQCEINGQNQYTWDENADENYFENDGQQYNEGQENFPIAVKNAQFEQNFAGRPYEGNTGENVQIFSQVPFQSDSSNVENMLRQISSKMDGFDQKFNGFDQKFDGINQQVGGFYQKVANLEQNLKPLSKQDFRLTYAGNNIPNNKNGQNIGAPPSQNQTHVEMQGTHLLSNVAENKQQNQHQSRKMQQDFCIHASNSNPPNNTALNTPNLEQQPPNSHFRFSYDEGNVPNENHKKCAPTQNQHQAMGDNRTDYLPKNCLKEKELQSNNYIQSQTIQTNSV
ncbi:MAG: hypothetical protein GY821_13585, partial [Gammaproteobacteria bacterium]|nr:hypothetical protein [Gammaproteobacteria bacterium]